jgi:hypothetical protein
VPRPSSAATSPTHRRKIPSVKGQRPPAFRHEDEWLSGSAGFACLCKNSWQDTLHRANRILFWAFHSKTFPWGKQERIVDEVPCATSPGLRATHATRPCMQRPVGWDTAFRREAAGMDAVIPQVG